MIPVLRAPEAILFDIGDTLLEERRFDLAAGIRAVLPHDPPRVAALTAAFRLATQEAHRSDRELLLADWLLEHLSPAVGAGHGAQSQVVEDTIWAVVVTLVPRPGAIAMLQRLQEDRVRVAAISNAAFSARVLSAELDRHGFMGLLQFVLSSGDFGWRKPARPIFEAALERLAVQAEHTWFVGDTLTEDMAGAVAAGLQPIWLGSLLGASPPPAPVIQVDNWSALARLYEVSQMSTRAEK